MSKNYRKSFSSGPLTLIAVEYSSSLRNVKKKPFLPILLVAHACAVFSEPVFNKKNDAVNVIEEELKRFRYNERKGDGRCGGESLDRSIDKNYLTAKKRIVSAGVATDGSK